MLLNITALSFKALVFNKQTTSEFSKEWFFPSCTLTFSIWETSIWEAFGEIIIKEWLLNSEQFQNTSLHPNYCIDFPVYLFILHLWKFLLSLENVYKEILH